MSFARAANLHNTGTGQTSPSALLPFSAGSANFSACVYVLHYVSRLHSSIYTLSYEGYSGDHSRVRSGAQWSHFRRRPCRSQRWEYCKRWYRLLQLSTFPFAAGVHMPHFEHGPSVRTVILINKSTYYLGNEREVGRLGFWTKGNTNIDISKTCFDKICRNKLRRYK